MNPRASAPRMSSGSRGRAHSASWRIVSAKYSGSAIERHQVLEDDPLRREVRDVADPIAQVERSSDVRSTVARSSRTRRRCESSCATRESASRSSSASLRRSGLRDRRPGATSCSTSAACRPAPVRNVRRWRRVDAEAGKPRARGCDVGLALAVEPLAALGARDDEAELLELTHELGRDRRALAELGLVDLVLVAEHARRSAGASGRSTRPGRRAPRGSRAAAGTRRAAASGSSSGARCRPARRAGSPRACDAAR